MRLRRTVVDFFLVFLALAFPRPTQGLALRRDDSLSRRDVFLQTVGSSARRRAAIASFLVTAAAAAPPPPISSSYALTPDQAATQYDTYAASYDQLDGGAASDLLGIAQARRDLIQQASGKVLEIGVGTGLNLDKYMAVGSNGQIESLTLVDISDGMLQEAAARVKTLPNLRGVPVEIVRADATSSELVSRFGSEAFDTVIDSFSLCVMGNQGAKKCLNQLATVVKKTGRLLLLENSRSSNPVLGLYQDATADAAASTGGKGCVYNQDVRAIIESMGRLDIVQETPYAAGLFRSFVCVPRR